MPYIRILSFNGDDDAMMTSKMSFHELLNLRDLYSNLSLLNSSQFGIQMIFKEKHISRY